MEDSVEPTEVINLLRNYQRDSRAYNPHDALKSPSKHHNYSSGSDLFLSRTSTAKKNLNFSDTLQRSKIDENVLKRKLLTSEADKASSDSVIALLNHRIANLQSESKQFKIEYTSKIEALGTENDQLRSDLEQLQNKLKLLEASWQIDKEKLSLEFEELQANKVKYHQNLLELLNKSASKDSDQQIAEQRQKFTLLQAKYLKLENESLILEQDNKNQQSQIKSLQEQLNKQLEKDSEICKLNSELTGLRIKNQKLTYELDCNKEFIVDETTENKLRKLSSLENKVEHLEYQNRMLKIEYDKVLLLEEKNRFLESEVARLMSKCKDSIILEEKCDDLSKELRKWESIGKTLNLEEVDKSDEHGKVGPQLLLQYIGNLQHKSLLDFQSAKENESRVKELQAEITALTGSMTQAKSMSSDADGELHCLMRDNKVLSLKLSLLEKEREVNWKILKSYEDQEPVDSLSVQRNVMTHLRHFREEIDKLILKISEHKSSPEAPALPPVQQPKILHLRDNPYDRFNRERQDELNHLKSENRSLKERIELMKKGENEDLTLLVDARVNAADSRTVDELKNKVDSLEKRNSSLVKSFKEAGNEFREMIYLLLGYKIDRKGNAYRVSSMYAASEQDYLLFQRLPDGEVRLLETPCLMQRMIQKLVAEHIHKHHSIPCFLSGLTNLLFAQQSILEST